MAISLPVTQKGSLQQYAEIRRNAQAKTPSKNTQAGLRKGTPHLSNRPDRTARKIKKGKI